MTQERESGQRLNIIIVAEGAIDREGNPITAEMIRKVCTAETDTKSNYEGTLRFMFQSRLGRCG